MSRQKIILKNVRLSFPSLFETETYNGQDTGKYVATFLIPKKGPQAKAVIDAYKACLKESFGANAKKAKSCVKDGDDVEYDGYAGHWAVKAGTKRRPAVLNRDKTPIVEKDGIMYAGCYVNASIEFYPIDNQFGKRVSASLNGIQFCEDGEPFAPGGFDEDDFDIVEGEPKPRWTAFDDKDSKKSDNPFDDSDDDDLDDDFDDDIPF